MHSVNAVEAVEAVEAVNAVEAVEAVDANVVRILRGLIVIFEEYFIVCFFYFCNFIFLWSIYIND